MKHRGLTAFALAASLAVVAGACGSDSGSSSDTTAAPAGTAAAGGSVAPGSLAGKKVTIFSSIRDEEAQKMEEAWKPFEDATGVDIVHEGSGEFETQLQIKVDGGNPPDLAFIPQPGLLKTLVGKGAVIEHPELKDTVAKDDIAGWVDLGSVDGKFYAPPFGANVKSFVWYNPEKFAEKGYEIPTTQEELIALTDKIVADGGTPWCVGLESGTATGWPATDWIEDYMLRMHGPEVYYQWVNHEIPFNDPKVLAAAEEAGKILQNEEYVQNGVKSAVTTSFQEGGLGILDGSCYMHRQASFYSSMMPEGTTLGPDGQANAFYFPVMKEGDPKVMLGGGEVIADFTGRPEVAEVMKYLTSADYANSSAGNSTRIYPNTGLDPSIYTDPLTKFFADQLQTSDVFAFDGSDLMPAAVGAGTFWTGIVDWITGKDLQAVLDDIEASWPK